MRHPARLLPEQPGMPAADTPGGRPRVFTIPYQPWWC